VLSNVYIERCIVAAISKAKKSSSTIHLSFEGKGQSTKVKTKNRCANTMQNNIDIAKIIESSYMFGSIGV